MTIEQLGRLIQAVTPDLVKLGNNAANSEWTHRTDSVEAMADLADDLERIAHEIRAYSSPDFTAPQSALSRRKTRVSG